MACGSFDFQLQSWLAAGRSLTGQEDTVEYFPHNGHSTAAQVVAWFPHFGDWVDASQFARSRLSLAWISTLPNSANTGVAFGRPYALIRSV